MLKKYIKSFIIVLIQFVPPLILIAIISQFLIKHPEVTGQLSHFFKAFKWAFLVCHAMFYAGLFLLWPTVVLFFSKRQKVPPAPEQLAKAIDTRLYLVGILVLIELFNLVR